jgi:hypothetical protein
MKMIFLSMTALTVALLSTAALAERNYDVRDSDTYMGRFPQNTSSNEFSPATILTSPLETLDRKEKRDLREKRRLNEKNNGSIK